MPAKIIKFILTSDKVFGIDRFLKVLLLFPAKDRVIVNERYDLSHEQINQIRKLSFLFCQKSILQIDIDMKEKTQKLLLPLIKTKIHNL